MLKNTVIAMDKYGCMLCDYLYDPEKGDKSQGIETGTAFNDLPEEWTCPKCGAKKEQFYLEED